MRLDGLAAPILTLFDPVGELDLGRNAAFARNLSESGVDHLFVLGTTGEFPSVTARERGPLIEVVVESATGHTDVWAGCGAPSTAQAVAFAQEAEEMGVDALVAVPPYYLHPSVTAIDHYYRALAKAVQLPLLAYNNPSTVGYALPPAVILRLAKDGVLSGIKDSGGTIESVSGYLTGAPKEFAVLPGDPPLATAAILRGARGAVMGVANVVPRLCVTLVHAALRGDWAQAAELQPVVDDLVAVVKAGPSPATFKFLAAYLRGTDVGYRAPYEPLTPDEEKVVLERLAPLRPRLVPFLVK
jgi:dihydrodipicolinate synthase/N-acetylneuraminate lyase